MLCRSGERGVTLLDTVVGTALMLVVFVGVVAVFKLSVDVVGNNKSRAAAIALANERMEYIHSLSYEAIGTSGGIPAGALAPSETISLNNATFTRRTLVVYGDDPGDGLGAADANNIPTDYKTARVEVSWPWRASSRSVSLVSRFQTPSGLEIDCDDPCGTLEVIVLNAASQPVSNARVDIDNTVVSPSVDLTAYTDINGRAAFVGAPVGSGYSIVVTKSGYSSAQTYGSNGQNPSPNPPHVSVANNQTSSLTFAIDLLTTKTVATRTQAGAALAGIPFTMRGAKYIGSNPTVYKYEQTFSNSSGTTTLSDLEWDTYTLAIDGATGYDIASSCDAPQPQYLAPASTQTTILYLAPHTANSLHADVRNNSGTLVSGATVRLVRNPGYDTTLVTDQCGQALFSALAGASSYSVTISAEGYTPKTVNSVNVNGASNISVSFD